MNKRIVIFGNGTLHELFLKELKPGDYIIGVDRAAYWLVTRGVIPKVAIGDFDSTSKKEMASITKSIRTIKRYPQEKNWTDMELAVNHAISLHPKEVIIFGGTGTRHDHTLSTFHLLDQLLAARILHTLIDETNRIRLIGRGKTVVKRSSYRYVSLLPYTKSIEVSLTGFRYDLSKTSVSRGVSLGVSNELRRSQGVIRMLSGKAWVIESND